MPLGTILRTSPRLVVVAEDEPLILELVAETLRDASFAVLEARNAAAVLAILRWEAAGVCLLFTDIGMPVGMDGLELAIQVRREWPWIALLLASGARRPSLAEIPKGGRFMAKPYDPWKMLAHVEAMTAA